MVGRVLHACSASGEQEKPFSADRAGFTCGDCTTCRKDEKTAIEAVQQLSEADRQSRKS